jgi:succinate dehydrogenase / fumarate reductase iron-sulfur subunit
MDVKLSVRRFDPDTADSKPYYQRYDLEVDESATVLDSLIALREEVDGTLALRCSCRSAICGSCAMRVNGSATLACKAKVIDASPSNGDPIVVEPAGNMSVVRDLVVDFSPFWEKVEQVDPWLHPEGPAPESEYVAPNEAMLHLAGVMACIMCGACVSDCTVLEVDENFVGPAALAKAYRFVADPRDDADGARLGKLNEYGGMWDCTRCMKCVEVCPKGVDPMGRIMSLRDKAMQAGYTGTYGARHAESFTQLIEHGGTLDELRLPIKTFGLFNIREMLKLLPVGIRSQLRGKMPPLFHKAIPGIENVRRLFRKTEGKR